MLCGDAWGTLAERRIDASGHYSSAHSGAELCLPTRLSDGKNLRFPQPGQFLLVQVAVLSASRSQLAVHGREPVLVALAGGAQCVLGIDVALTSQADHRQQ